MKRVLSFIVSIAVIATIAVVPVKGHAGWKLYDNFDSGVIDLDRWDIDDSSATISIVDGRARFVHDQGFAEDGSWLIIKKKRKKIKGIMATVMVESCTGDVRARIAGYSGKVKLEGHYIWDQLALQGGRERIRGSRDLKEAGTFDTLYHPFWGRFEQPMAIIGNPFIITMTFSPKKVKFGVSYWGKFAYKLPGEPDDYTDTDNYFKGIGTYSENGDGPCVVYFDDVYVLIK